MSRLQETKVPWPLALAIIILLPLIAFFFFNILPIKTKVSIPDTPSDIAVKRPAPKEEEAGRKEQGFWRVRVVKAELEKPPKRFHRHVITPQPPNSFLTVIEVEVEALSGEKGRVKERLLAHKGLLPNHAIDYLSGQIPDLFGPQAKAKCSAPRVEDLSTRLFLSSQVQLVLSDGANVPVRYVNCSGHGCRLFEDRTLHIAVSPFKPEQGQLAYYSQMSVTAAWFPVQQAQDLILVFPVPETTKEAKLQFADLPPIPVKLAPPSSEGRFYAVPQLDSVVIEIAKDGGASIAMECMALPKKVTRKDTLEKPAKAQPQVALDKRYKWKTDQPFREGPVTHRIAITGAAGGNNIKTIEGGRILVEGNTLIIDGPGTHDVHIRIDRAIGATEYAGLTFTTPCVVSIREDCTLCADKEGIVAKDQKGQNWKSSSVSLDGKELNVFFLHP